jgi:hypothetical protein
VPAKDINKAKGRLEKWCFNMETSEQCILDKWQDNGANHALNSRIKVNKALTENEKICVITKH